MYILGWGSMGISEMLTKLLIGGHTDQSWYDVDDEGNPWNYSNRSVIHCGQGFIFIVELKFIWAVPTDTICNGKVEYVKR